VTEVTDRPAGAGAGDDSIAERDRRIEGLRAKYRSLQEIDERQRAILGELAAIDGIDDPDGGDFIWQGSLIREHDDLEHMAQKPRKRARDLERVRAAHEDPANREESVPRTPDLQTRNTAGKDPFRDMERVQRGLVDPEEVRGRALDGIEIYSQRGDLAHDFAENATRMVQDQFFGTANVARHVLETGTPDYYDAFREYLSDPGKYSARAALTLTSANGGYLLPFVLDRLVA